jgi:hypothetical protein
MNYVLKSVKVSDFTQNTELQNSYQLDSYGCPAQAENLNTITALTPPAVALFRPFKTKRNVSP